MISEQMNSFGDSSKLTEQASKSYWENHLRHFWRIWKLSIVQCPCWLLNTCQFSTVTQADDFRESAQVWLHAVHGSIRKLSVRSKHIFFFYRLSVTVSVLYYKRESGLPDARNFKVFWTELIFHKLRAVSLSFSSDLVRGTQRGYSSKQINIASLNIF